MKKSFFTSLCLLGLVCAAQAQSSFTLNIDAGALRTADGSGTVVQNGLLQLIASPSGTFSNPTTSSFVSGDNVLIQSFGVNLGGTGETTNTLSSIAFTTTNYTVTTGEALLLRFYPSLTYSAATNYRTTAPNAMTSFGQVRSSNVEFGPPNDPTETGWFVPAQGANVDLNYVTVSNGGTYANNTAYATGTVAVPEPSSVMLLGGAAVGLLGWARLRRRAA